VAILKVSLLAVESILTISDRPSHIIQILIGMLGKVSDRLAIDTRATLIGGYFLPSLLEINPRQKCFHDLYAALPKSGKQEIDVVFLFRPKRIRSISSSLARSHKKLKPSSAGLYQSANPAASNTEAVWTDRHTPTPFPPSSTLCHPYSRR
jgi:hypothetical protein